MKKQLIADFDGSVPKHELCQWLSIPRSTCYYKASGGKRGAKPSTHTPVRNGMIVTNQVVVDALITDVFSQEFNRYGYQLSTEELRAMGYIINPKKTYRLMAENGLLLGRLHRNRHPKQWVRWRRIKDAKPLEYLCMDIKAEDLSRAMIPLKKKQFHHRSYYP